MVNTKMLQDKIPHRLLECLEYLKELRPCQEKAINAGLLEGKNLLVCSPTASGKTLVGEIACVKTILESKNREKAVYVVPLKALASEKFRDFSNKYGKIGVKVAQSSGDYEDVGHLEKHDLIVCTSEKLDSLMRHNVSWIKSVKVVVIDEIHLLNDIERGPTLEVLITMLRRVLKAQFIGLSATIGNPEELAGWLNAELVVDDWRPVKLYEGIFHDGIVDFFEAKENYKMHGNDEATVALAIDTIRIGKQSLVFVNSKKSAEAVAERIALKIGKESTSKNVDSAKGLYQLSSEALNCLHSPTSQCKRLAEVLRYGVAFHHSGLVSKQREIIENAFRNGVVKIICCTPTLSAGIDIPAFRAILKDLRRYGSSGLNWIPTLEYKQQAGRCGRPSFDSFGEAISVASTEDEKDEIFERFVCGEVEGIYSKLAVEPVLRTYVLSLIATGFVNGEKSLLDFFRETFYAYQYKDFHEIEEKLEVVLGNLVEYGFIRYDGEMVYATAIGKRISQLYIDPETGWHLIRCIKCTDKKKMTPMVVLQAICQTLEMRPLLKARRKDVDAVDDFILENHGSFLTEIPSEFDYEYEGFVSSCKTAMVFHSWIDEISDDMIMEQHNVRPGELRSKLEIADWLLYSFYELAKLLEFREILQDVGKLRVRMKYGAKEELIGLLKLRNIGRVRARMLFRNKIKSLDDVRKADVEVLAKIIGPTITKDIKEQLGFKVENVTARQLGQQKLDEY